MPRPSTPRSSLWGVPAPTSPSQALRRRIGVGIAVLLVLALALWAVKSVASGEDTEAATSSSTSAPSSQGKDGASDTKGEDGKEKQTKKATKSASPTLPPYHSTGEYEKVSTESKVRGTGGQLVTYSVEVEKGSGVDPEKFASFVDTVLDNPRGWTADGEARFQRVTGEGADLRLHLATPDTVDDFCYAAGFKTLGKVSCTVGPDVMFNLDRWYIGVDQVDDLKTYRQYLINHEIGHYLGHPHEACPGKGEVAPVMLQQTFSLDGCKPNAWPRAADGSEIHGPPSNE